MLQDALGNPVVQGETYGYSSSSNGYSWVMIGVAEKLGEKLVTLRITRRRHFLYNEPTDYQRTTAATVSINPHHLFPVKQ